MQVINFQLNGVPRKVITDPQKKLLEVIRKDLKLVGTKEGCSAGHCGTCTVLIDGEPVLACRYPVSKVQGRSVTTIEGIGYRRTAPPAAIGLCQEPGPFNAGFARRA